MTEPKATGGMFTRVAGVYPLAIPAVFVALAAMFPDNVFFDMASGEITVKTTTAQLGIAVGGGYAIIGGVFAKWGKR